MPRQPYASSTRSGAGAGDRGCTQRHAGSRSPSDASAGRDQIKPRCGRDHLIDRGRDAARKRAMAYGSGADETLFDSGFDESGRRQSNPVRSSGDQLIRSHSGQNAVLNWDYAGSGEAKLRSYLPLFSHNRYRHFPDCLFRTSCCCPARHSGCCSAGSLLDLPEPRRIPDLGLRWRIGF